MSRAQRRASGKRQVPKGRLGQPRAATRELALLDALGEIERAADAVKAETDALNLAVARARRLGGSWSRIARAADLTPQGAHSRWRETLPKPKPAGKAPEAAPQGPRIDDAGDD